MILDSMPDKKVLLCNVDILSKKVSKADRNDYPLIGDGAAVTVIENDPNAGRTTYSMNMDGSRRNVLRIPAGGFRQPNTPETGELKDIGDGNLRALDHLHMDGREVFNFVQTDAPPCIEETIQRPEVTKEDIDYSFFHQPNKFMIQKLRQKLGVPEEKVPDDLVTKYGNPSGASIPLIITDSMGDKMETDKYLCCLSAFGSGLAWGALVTELGNMDFCRLVESDL